MGFHHLERVLLHGIIGGGVIGSRNVDADFCKVNLIDRRWFGGLCFPAFLSWFHHRPLSGQEIGLHILNNRLLNGLLHRLFGGLPDGLLSQSRLFVGFTFSDGEYLQQEYASRYGYGRIQPQMATTGLLVVLLHALQQSLVQVSRHRWQFLFPAADGFAQRVVGM